MTRLAALISFVAAIAAVQQTIPTGTIVDDVKCAGDPSQSYALYLPSGYTANRAWPVLFAFHPAARGRAMVEKYAAAAEQYGFIVAGSNNSRNGSRPLQRGAVAAMPADVARRFAVDPKRVYLTGMSGGSRVALEVALGTNDVAGVIASSAGYPDSETRSRLPFPIFATAGYEDFNYLEMRLLDRALTTPHRLAIFEGGHTLPPDSVALDAVEWMELQAMKVGRRTRDEALIDRLLQKRRDAIGAATSDLSTLHLLDALVVDFEGLRDVTVDATRAQVLARQPQVKRALGRERADDDADWRKVNEIIELERGLSDSDMRAQSLLRLRSELRALARATEVGPDAPARSRARRLLRMILAGAAERVSDPEYRAILDQYRESGRR